MRYNFTLCLKILDIGVKDNGEIVGLDNADFVIKQISNSLRDSINPDVSMFTNIELLQEDNKYFVKLTVSDSFDANRSIVQELTFYRLNDELQKRGLEFAEIQMKLIEAYGIGISKIISCYKGLPVQPKFENVEGAFRVVLPNMHAQKFSAKNEKYLPILRLFEKQKEITRSDVENALGIGTTYAINMLKAMQEKEHIIKVGNGRLTRYVMK